VAVVAEVLARLRLIGLQATAGMVGSPAVEPVEAVVASLVALAVTQETAEMAARASAMSPHTEVDWSKT